MIRLNSINIWSEIWIQSLTPQGGSPIFKKTFTAKLIQREHKSKLCDTWCIRNPEKLCLTFTIIFHLHFIQGFCLLVLFFFFSKHTSRQRYTCRYICYFFAARPLSILPLKKESKNHSKRVYGNLIIRQLLIVTLFRNSRPEVVCEKDVLENFETNSQENTCARACFLIRLQAWGLQHY